MNNENSDSVNFKIKENRYIKSKSFLTKILNSSHVNDLEYIIMYNNIIQYFNILYNIYRLYILFIIYIYYIIYISIYYIYIYISIIDIGDVN